MEITEEEKLPKDFKEKWIKALRSGSYPQTTGTLFREYPSEITSNNAGYCCLGVAGAVCGLSKERLSGNGSFHEYSEEYLEEYGVPKTLRGGIGDDRIVNHLVSMNDSEKLSFNEIADWIEE